MHIKIQGQVSMTKSLKVNDSNLSELALESKNLCGRSLAWSRTSACHADDPGSNLGDRTKNFLFSEREPLLRENGVF